MILIDIKTNRQPYGIAAVATRSGFRLQLKTPNGTKYYTELPRAVAKHLRDQLDAALATDGAAVG